MNAFANNIFSILFSWLRSLTESLWHSAASGSFSALLTWLGDHWIVAVAVLCVLCTVLDYLVWLIRWRPYVIWRQKILRLFGRSTGKAKEAEDFEQGYLGGVEIALPEMPQTRQDANVYPAEYWETPVQEAPAPAVYEAAPPQIYQAETPPVFTPPAAAEAPAAEASAYIPSDANVPLQRRRRSARHEKRAATLPEKLLAADDEEDRLLDGLPPVVDHKTAFRQPVYPDKSAQALWPDAQDGNKNG